MGEPMIGGSAGTSAGGSRPNTAPNLDLLPEMSLENVSQLTPAEIGTETVKSSKRQNSEPFIRTSTKNENHREKDDSEFFTWDQTSYGKIPSPTKGMNQQPTPTLTFEDFHANNLKLEAKRKELERNLQQKIADLELQYSIQKDQTLENLKEKLESEINREKDLLEIKNSQAKDRVATLEKEIVKEKEAKLMTERLKIDMEIENSVEKYKDQLERENSSKLEKLKISLNEKLETDQNELEENHENKLKSLKTRLDQNFQEKEKSLKLDFDQKLERSKSNISKNNEILNSQKDDLETELATQLQRLTEQHQREIDSLSADHLNDLARIRREKSDFYKSEVRRLDEQNELQLENTKKQLKENGDLQITNLQNTLQTTRTILESEKISLENKLDQLKIEESNFLEKEHEFKAKMEKLENEFSNLQKTQERELKDSLFELNGRKEQLDSEIAERTAENDNMRRNNERLKLEFNEYSKKLAEIKDKFLQEQHQNDLREIDMVSQNLKKLQKETKAAMTKNDTNDLQ